VKAHKLTTIEHPKISVMKFHPSSFIMYDFSFWKYTVHNAGDFPTVQHTTAIAIFRVVLECVGWNLLYKSHRGQLVRDEWTKQRDRVLSNSE
jgi:hypothetical protein